MKLPAVPPSTRDHHELLHLGEIFNALAYIAAHDRRGSFDICELGCGTGWLANELTAFGKVTAVDPDAGRIAHARGHYADVTFEADDLLTWSAPRQFDLVVSSEVIEHLAEQRRYAEALKRITKPGGWLLVTTPNKKLKPYWDAADMGEGLYENWLGISELRALFADCSIARHTTFLHDFAYTGVYRWLNAKKWLAMLEACKVAPFYAALRQMLGHGLYQLLLCRKH